MRISFYVVFVFISSILFAFDDIEVNPNTPHLDVFGSTYRFSDSTKSLSIEQVIDLPSNFWKKGTLKGYSKDHEWVRVTFVNNTRQPIDKVLYLSNAISHKVDFFFLVDGKLSDYRVETGLARSRKSKLYNDPGYPIKVNFPPQSKVDVLIKTFDPLSSLQVPLHLLSEQKAYELKDKNLRFLFFWIGILIISIVLAAILFASTRQNMFFFYVMFAIATGIIISATTGVVTMFFDSDPFQIVTNYYQWGAILMIVFMPRFINSLVQISGFSKRGWRLLKILGYVAICIGILYSLPFFKFNFFFTHLFINTIVGISGVLFLYVLVTLLWASIKRVERALPLFIVYLIYLSLGFSNVILPLFGATEESITGIHYVLTGSILETLAFMIFMGQAALSVYKERAELLELARDNQKQMMSAIVKGQEEERNRFARDLHDGFGQMISALNLNLNGLKTLKSTDIENRSKIFSTSNEILNNMQGELKNICFDLMPQTLIKHGLEAAIREFSSRINNSGEKTVEVNVFGLDRLTELQEISIYRITQEWVNNVLKYSEAEHITIQITKDEKELTVLIEDDGMGFDKNLLASGGGNGWKNMNSRANLINAEIELDTVVGLRGNTMILNVSLDKRKESPSIHTKVSDING